MSESSGVATETADAASNPKFTSSNCGSEIGSATGGPLYPRDGKASINGNTDLSQCIKGQRGSHVNSIAMETYKGVVYRYKIRVNGRGPSGFGQRAHLTFTLEGGEEATLSIASTTVEDHTVKIRTGGLVLIAWNFS
jgi:hypothetical protein